MTCAVCGIEVPVMEHQFFEGVAPHADINGHRKIWTVTAPLYYRSTPDFRGVVEGYCGPEHALERMRY